MTDMEKNAKEVLHLYRAFARNGWTPGVVVDDLRMENWHRDGETVTLSWGPGFALEAIAVDGLALEGGAIADAFMAAEAGGSL